MQRGCVPLLVTFGSESLNAYYWDFGDGTDSNFQNPEHNYTVAGDYIVTLREGVNGTQIGQLSITIYPEVNIEIYAVDSLGCIPFEASFTSYTESHPDNPIDSLVWTMGDGTLLTGERIMHTYQIEKVFDVSVEAHTPFCEVKTDTFPKIVEAEDLTTTIRTGGDRCTIPTLIKFLSTKTEDERYTYEWDFGNDQSPSTSNIYAPDSVLFTAYGEYDVSLITTSPSGCVDTTYHTVKIGGPEASVSLPDTVCLDQVFQVVNTTPTLSHAWTWENGVYGDDNPEIFFESSGLKNINYRATLDLTCYTDTNFQVFVEVPDASFTLDPEKYCSNIDEIPRLIASNPNYQSYIWNDSITTSPTYLLENIIVERDSFYIPVPLSITGTLEVISNFGCINDTMITFENRTPEAYYQVDKRQGFLQATITFTDLSKSNVDIIRRKWMYDDGTPDLEEFPPFALSHQHTYDTCGLYHPLLVIEDSDGCIDTSSFIEIDIFGCQNINVEDGELDVDSTDIITVPTRCYCVNDFVSFGILHPIFDSHMSMDQNRFNDCWASSNDYQLTHPGIFDRTLSIEYNGLEIESRKLFALEVCGARAEFEYKIDCDKPYTIELLNKSINATEWEWLIDGTALPQSKNQETYIHKFDTEGEYTISLVSKKDDINNCTADKYDVTVYITEPKANFTMPEIVCDSVPTLLDAGSSEDVFGSCYAGYLWEFESGRPRETGQAILEHEFQRGEQEVNLTITDINGCTDKVSKSLKVLGLDPHFELDSALCFPYPKQFENLSTGDTTITAWRWSFDSMEQNPFFEFTEDDLNPDKPDTLSVSLAIEDIFGCRDTLQLDAPIIEPAFGLQFSGGNEICQGGESKIFSIIDSLGYGALFDYTWTVGDTMVATGSTLDYQFNVIDTNIVIANIQQKVGGCNVNLDSFIVVRERPIASFVSDQDSAEYICHPAQIEFTATTPGNGLTYEWSTSQGDPSNQINPSFDFGEGTHDVQLIVNNGICTDTITKTVTLSGPTGEITLDRNTICLNETITFSLTNQIGVDTYTWDFGDGTTVTDTSPVSHQFNFSPQNDLPTKISVFLQAPGAICNGSDSIDIYIRDVVASFSPENLDLCFPANEILFESTSLGENLTYDWSFGDFNMSTEENPTVDFDRGTHEIQMIATDDINCADTLRSIVNVSGAAGLILIDDDNICAGDPITVDLLDTIGVANYTWDFGDGTIVNNQSPVTYQYDPNLSGQMATINLVLEAPNGVCNGTDSINVAINQLIADFINLDSLNICNSQTRFQNQTIGADTYLWDFGNGNTSTEINPIETFDAGSFSVSLFASNSLSGCEDFTELEITVQEEVDQSALFPNFFSPNGDNKNDTFGPIIPDGIDQEVTIVTLKIYNRWGELVYDNALPDGWTGLYKGQEAPPEVYAYYMEILIEGCDPIAKKGNVTLLR